MWQWFRQWRSPALLRVVLVNMKHSDQEAIRGVLWATRGPWLQLREASLLTGAGEARSIDGEVLVPRDNVAYLQLLP